MNAKKEAFRKRIFEIIQIGKHEDGVSRLFDIGIVITIIANIAMMYLETFDELQRFYPTFQKIEGITLVIFCLEYALRIWTADFLFKGETRGKAIWRFLRSFDGVVDLLTILPFFFLSGFIAFRMLRVVRIFHLFRINATYDSFNVITSVLKEKKNQIVSSLFIIIILMMAAALCMYNAEHEAQPELFQNAFSGIWWSVSALLTVGYGDIYPITIVGRISAIIISFLGVGAVAIPTGIISAGFYEQYAQVQNQGESFTVSVQAISVDIDSRWIGHSVKDVLEKERIAILLAERGGTVMTPGENYRVQLGDMLQVYRLPQKPSDTV